MTNCNLMNRGMHHVGFVVKNLENAIEKFEADFGIIDFARYLFVPRKAWYRGEALDGFRLQVGMLAVQNGCTIELVQPLEGRSLFREFLDNGDEGLHHITFNVDNFEWWKGDLQRRDIPLLFESETEDTTIGFRRNLFFNDRTLGTIFEIREIPYFRV